MQLILLDNENLVQRTTVEAVHPTAPLVACDFYIAGIEAGQEVTGGFQLGRILNIDHHAAVASMARTVSSTNLAIDRVRQCGLPAPESRVIITHTDCDSVLSAAIMAGRVPPEDILGEAAIAADHSGEENSIADLLQGLQQYRDFELSFHNLNLLLLGRKVDLLAEEALNERKRKREKAYHVAARFQQEGSLFYLALEEDTDSEFFPALLPDAALILVAMPKPHDNRYSYMKLRLGTRAKAGFSINDLNVSSFDPGYGGRWNAGSNKRDGGTLMTIEHYVEALSRNLECWQTAQA